MLQVFSFTCSSSLPVCLRFFSSSFLRRLVGELTTTGVGRPDFTFGQFGVITL